MSNLRTKLDAYRGGIALAVVGGAGTGKSTLLGSIGELYKPEEVLLLAPKPREINSWKYREFGFHKTAEVFSDMRWRPSLEIYEANSFLELERRLLELYEDTQYKVIILDPYTDVVAAASHDILKADRAATPRDTPDSRGFYGSLKHKLGNFTKTLVGLSSPALVQPKHVLVAVHAQSAKDDEKAGGSGVSFEGDVLPMIEGGHRNDFAGEFDLVVYTRIKHGTELVNRKPVKTVRYMIQVDADPKRHAKTALTGRLDLGDLENNLPKFLEKIL